jgi:hypothetical protein
LKSHHKLSCVYNNLLAGSLSARGQMGRRPKILVASISSSRWGDNIMKCTESCVVCLIQQSWSRASALICSSSRTILFQKRYAVRQVRVAGGGAARRPNAVAVPNLRPAAGRRARRLYSKVSLLTSDCAAVKSCWRLIMTASLMWPMSLAAVNSTVYFET